MDEKHSASVVNHPKPGMPIVDDFSRADEAPLSDGKYWTPTESGKWMQEARDRFLKALGEDAPMHIDESEALVWQDEDYIVRVLVGSVRLGVYETDGRRLVCGNKGTPGDAPGRCLYCKSDVRIAREHVKLWGGKEEPPMVCCRVCWAKNDSSYWSPSRKDPPKGWPQVETMDEALQDLQDSTQDYIAVSTDISTHTISTLNSFKQATSAYKVFIDKFDASSWVIPKGFSIDFIQDSVVVSEDEGAIRSCRECGSMLSVKLTKNGAKICPKCQRKQWRRKN